MRHFLGPGHPGNCAEGEENSRRHFLEKDAKGNTVNRCEGIAFSGGCTDTNEFNMLVVKTMRSLGVCYLENQARV